MSDPGRDLRRRLIVLSVAYFGLLAVVLATRVPLLISTRNALSEQRTTLAPAQSDANRLLSALVDEETGARGYVITGNEAFLVPYDRGQAATARYLRDLERLLTGRATRESLAELTAAIDRWQHGSAEPEIAAAKRDLAEARALVAAGAGKERFDDIRDAHRRLQRLIDARVAASRDEIDDSTTTLLVTLVAAVAAAAVLALVTTLWFRTWSNDREARLARERERSVGLSRLAARLAAGSTINDVVAVAVADVIAPMGARSGSIAILDESVPVLRVYRFTGSAAFDPGAYELVEPTSPEPLVDALTDAVWLPSPADRSARYPGVDVDVDVDAKALAAVALVVRGRVFGSMSIEWEREQPFDDTQRAEVAVVAAVCSQSLARAVSFETNARVGELGERLAEVQTLDELVEELTASMNLAVGSRAARLATATPTGADLITVSGTQVDHEVVGLDARLPVLEVIRTGRPVVVDSRSNLSERFPDLDETAEQLHLESLAVFPVALADGSIPAAIGWSWSSEWSGLDDEIEAALLRLVGIVSKTWERVRVTGVEHQLVLKVSERIARMPPRIVGFEVAQRYRPALSVLGFGGDWTDIIDLGDARLGAVVGDVVGHGVDAAADMARLRVVLETLVLRGTSPQELFPLAAKLIGDGREMLGTCAYAEIDRTAGTVRTTRAGHPPPLLRNPDGAVTEVAGGGHPVLGLATSRVACPPVPFPPGAVLLMFTDGLIERRDRTYDDGLSGLAASLGRHGEEPIDVLADRLLEQGGDAPADDQALLVVRSTL